MKLTSQLSHPAHPLARQPDKQLRRVEPSKPHHRVEHAAAEDETSVTTTSYEDEELLVRRECFRRYNSECTFYSDSSSSTLCSTSVRRHVQFQNEVQIHFRDLSQENDQVRQLWYSSREIHRFQKDNVLLARSIQQRPSCSKMAWFQALEAVHKDFLKPSPVSSPRLQQTIDVSLFQVDLIGLEHVVLESLLCDRNQRRVALYQQIQNWQKMGDLLDATSRDAMMQKISEELSRPSCALARYLADVVASTHTIVA